MINPMLPAARAINVTFSHLGMISVLSAAQRPSPAPADDRAEQFAEAVFGIDHREGRSAVAFMDPQHIRPAAVIFGDGLGIGMQTESRPGLCICKIFHFRDLICVKDFLNAQMQRLLLLVMTGKLYLDLVELKWSYLLNLKKCWDMQMF